MMKLFGWKRPDMVGVYSHLTMKDVEDYELMLHGLKPRDEVLRPLVQVVTCPKCGEENAPSIFLESFPEMWDGSRTAR